MSGKMHRPRLLPITIAAMTLLLIVKSVSLVWAATGGAKPAGEGAPSAQTSAAGAAAAAPNGGSADNATATPIANAEVSQRPKQLAEAAPLDAGQPAQAVADSPAALPVSDAERTLLLDLRHRRAALDERGLALDQRNAVLGAAETKLAGRVEQLGALQAKLEQLETDRRAHDDANWTGLVHVYETMKPREAATIFDALDMQVLLAVLDRMQPRRAAPVLAAMQPDRARLATQMLAEMRTRAITPAVGQANGSSTQTVPKE